MKRQNVETSKRPFWNQHTPSWGYNWLRDPGEPGSKRQNEGGAGIERVVCDLVPGFDDSGAALKAIRLAPDGLVRSTQGDFVIDAEGFRLIETAFAEHGVRVPIDYEHQSLGGEYSSPDGKAPAAGWIHAIKYVKGEGLFGEVEWLVEAAEAIRSRKYLYLSPVVIVRKDDRKAVGLHSAALTNKPAIRHMQRLAATQRKENDVPKDTQANQEETEGAETTPDLLLGQITGLLKQKGVAVQEGASRNVILQAVITFLEGGSAEEEGEGGEAAEVASSVRAELGLKQTAGKDEVVVALSTLKHKAAADGDVATLQAELNAMKDREAEREAKELVGAGIKANKVNPNDAEHVTRCIAFAKKDPEGYREFMEGVTPYAPPGRTEPPARGAASSNGSDAAEDKLIAEALAAHKDNTKEAYVALQTRLLDEECAATGYTRKKAGEVLSQRYPKIFA